MDCSVLICPEIILGILPKIAGIRLNSIEAFEECKVFVKLKKDLVHFEFIRLCDLFIGEIFKNGGVKMSETKGERSKLLELYQDLRVADVRDGMDFNLLHHYGSMSYRIRPLFRTRAVGIAKTVRYLPYQGKIPALTQEEYREWAGWYYNHVCTYPWIDEVEEGDFVVIDQSGVDAGLMGSHNTLVGVSKGVKGYVTNGGVRDTDEIIIQQIPFWSRLISQTMVQGRLQFDDMNISVNVGGVVVNPGDVVVADGDGVIVVPKEIAYEVAKTAHGELKRDKKVRKELYEKLRMEFDETVK